jgi:hypothetical protein
VAGGALAGVCAPIAAARHGTAVRVKVSDDSVTGVLAVTDAFNKCVATSSVQSPPPGIDVDTVEFWLPKHRPDGRNFAMSFEPPLDVFAPGNVVAGPARPVESPNAWVADPADLRPELYLAWNEAVELGRVILELDPDWESRCS